MLRGFVVLSVIFGFACLGTASGRELTTPSPISNHGSGRATYGKTTVEAIDFHGTLQLDGTKITERLEVHGRLSADGAVIKELEVFGFAKLRDTQVQGATLVNGSLDAKHSTFDGPLSIAVGRAIFD